MGRNKDQTTKEFMDSYERECQRGIAYNEAYESAEKIYKEANGSNKYSGIASFKASRSRLTKRNRKG